MREAAQWRRLQGLTCSAKFRVILMHAFETTV